MSNLAMVELQREADRCGRELVVGALVVRQGTLFAQRRAYDRKLFPGCWDVAGGHVEAGETLRDALVRELREETGWELDEVLGLALAFDWEKGESRMREYDFVVTVKGDAEAVLEEGKAIEGRWIGLEELDVVRENQPDGGGKMREIFAGGFATLRELGLSKSPG